MTILPTGFGALGVLFLLGMRHGLDPDHIAVIDNITFRALDERPRVAAWTGFLFSLGHSLSVMVIALIFGFVGKILRFAPWFEHVMAILVVGLLVLVGTLNLRLVLTKDPFKPQGWRSHFMPRILRDSTHPFVTLAIGVIFGLVIDTAAQVATWGATAATAGGLGAAALVGLCFAVGMVVTDSVDSFIVSHLLSGTDNTKRAMAYRRIIGWLIVALSYGMAALGALAIAKANTDLSDGQVLILGIVMAAAVILPLLYANLSSRRSVRRSGSHG